MDGFFGCENDGHKVRDCLDHKTKGREGKQATTNSEKGVPKVKARLFSLKSKGDQ